MDVESRIFEKGSQIFGQEIEYGLRHLGFLISVNDDDSEWLFAQWKKLCV
jgi:cleavage stimulation factor subunit 3